MRWIWMIPVALLVWRCGGTGSPSTDEEVEKLMRTYEDSLNVVGTNPDKFTEVMATSDRYIDMLLRYAEEHPEAEKTPECLDKAHMLLTGTGKTEEAVKWAEVLIEKYPAYVNRPMVLESLASAYDYGVEPRDSVKVRNYYELLLKENPDMDAEKREGIERRLEMNSVPLDRYMELMILRNAENQ